MQRKPYKKKMTFSGRHCLSNRDGPFVLMRNLLRIHIELLARIPSPLSLDQIVISSLSRTLLIIIQQTKKRMVVFLFLPPRRSVDKYNIEYQRWSIVMYENKLGLPCQSEEEEEEDEISCFFSMSAADCFGEGIFIIKMNHSILNFYHM